MAKHDVSFIVPRRPLSVTDIEFYVRTDGRNLGKLAVSNGSLVWFPKGKKTGFKIGWKKFDELMREWGRRSERR